MKFSYLERAQNLDRLQREEFDLAIIGGGITGAGVARDAASRGMKVALIEAHDFAYGTSSRSSKLIHGGIRYLENLEFGLVFEALSERKILFEIAPHLVHPLRFVLPVYRGGRVGMTKLGLGMWLYDALSLFQAPELHERLNAGALLARVPVLKSTDALGGFVYSDAYMDDDRLVIETLRSASRWGAVCANYVGAIGAEFCESKMTAIRCQDVAGREFSVRAKHFVSTVGPWTDELAERLCKPWKKILRPSKGIHLTLPRSRLGLQDAVVMADDAEERIVFCIPRYEMVILGTTDTHYDGDPGSVRAETKDVQYLLEIADQYFPGARLSHHDILGSYAGVRPLVQDNAKTEGKTSREHTILSDPHNVTFVAGGKYTTYRHIAEQTMKVVLRNFSVEKRMQFRQSQTHEPLNPLASVEMLARAQTHIEIWVKNSSLSPHEISDLALHHGMETESILESAAPVFAGEASTKFRGNTPGATSIQFWCLQAAHAIDHTMCLNLDDFYWRRSHLFLARLDHGRELLEPLSHVFAFRLGWSDEFRRQQVARVLEHINFELEWKKSFPQCPVAAI